MSSYKGHLFGGIIFFIPLCIVLSYFSKTNNEEVYSLGYILNFIILLGITLLFSLFPDIDIKSKGQKIFYMIFIIADTLLLALERWQEAAFLGLFAMLPLVSKHRGWTHSHWAVFLVPAPFLIIPIWHSSFTLSGLPYYLAGVTGLISHRIMDRM